MQQKVSINSRWVQCLSKNLLHSFHVSRLVPPSGKRTLQTRVAVSTEEHGWNPKQTQSTEKIGSTGKKVDRADPLFYFWLNVQETHRWMKQKVSANSRWDSMSSPNLLHSFQTHSRLILLSGKQQYEQPHVVYTEGRGWNPKQTHSTAKIGSTGKKVDGWFFPRWRGGCAPSSPELWLLVLFRSNCFGREWKDWQKVSVNLRWLQPPFKIVFHSFKRF